jgi:hypothetical protein
VRLPISLVFACGIGVQHIYIVSKPSHVIKFAHLLIQPNFLFAAQTDFPWAGIVASLRIMPPAGYANIPTSIWVQIGCGASAVQAKIEVCQAKFST